MTLPGYGCLSWVLPGVVEQGMLCDTSCHQFAQTARPDDHDNLRSESLHSECNVTLPFTPCAPAPFPLARVFLHEEKVG